VEKYLQLYHILLMMHEDSQRKVDAFIRTHQPVVEFTPRPDKPKICETARGSGAGLWMQFKSDAPDELLRSNVKVFLAGALEATTSYATWAISHLARNLPAQ